MKRSTKTGRSIREVVVERGHVPDRISEEQLDEVLDVLSMTRPS